MTKGISTRGAFFVAACMLLVGCAGDPAADPTGADTDRAPAGTPAVITPELEAKLAVADRADGEEDGVVTLCPGCGLAMEGSLEHALDVGDYALHFCSERCKGDFSEDVKSSLVALVVPEEEPPLEEPADQP